MGLRQLRMSQPNCDLEPPRSEAGIFLIPTDSAVLHRRFRAKIKGVFPNGIVQAWQGVLACCPQIPGRKQWNGHYASQQGSPHAGLSKTTPPRLMKHSGYTLTVGFRPRVSSLAAQPCNRYLPATAWVEPVSLALPLPGRLCGE